MYIPAKHAGAHCDRSMPLKWVLQCSSDIVCLTVQEINLMEKLSFDRNIVQFYGAVLSGTAPMLILEYMEGNTAVALM